MHLDEERLQRLLDGELSKAEERAAREHLESCRECGRRLADAEREAVEVRGLLGELDASAPASTPELVAIAAEARGRRTPMLQKVAGLVVALGIVGAAYALPGSPLPRWLGALSERIGGAASRPSPAPQAPADTSGAGVAVVPGANLVIEFLAPHGMAEIVLDDQEQLVIRAPAGAATFTSEADRLVVDNRVAAATFQIRIPHAAPRVEMRVAGEQMFLKQDEQIVTTVQPLSPNHYQVPLARP